MKTFKNKIDKNGSLSADNLKEEYYDKGYDDGISDGNYEARIEITKKLISMNFSDKDIVNITGINPLELKVLN